MENNKFEKTNSSANSAPTGWESLEAEGRHHDLMLKVKSKFTAEKFKRAASIAMLGLMTAATISAGKSDANTVEHTMSTETEADLSDPRTAQENFNENISNEELADLISTHSKGDYDVTNGQEDILGETPEYDNLGPGPQKEEIGDSKSDTVEKSQFKPTPPPETNYDVKSGNEDILPETPANEPQKNNIEENEGITQRDPLPQTVPPTFPPTPQPQPEPEIRRDSVIENATQTEYSPEGTGMRDAELKQNPSGISDIEKQIGNN